MEIIIFRLLMAVEVIVCLLLIGIVLIQRSKGQGVGLSFGGGAEAIFGAQVGNVIVRATVVLGIVFLVNTVVLAVLRPTAGSESIAERDDGGKAAASTAPVTAPTAEEAAAALDMFGDEAVIPLENTVDAPAVEAVPVEAPAAKAEVPETEAPAAEAPAAEVPAAEAPAAEATATETPAAETETPAAE
jgi:protein translocase, SecG subunit